MVESAALEVPMAIAPLEMTLLQWVATYLIHSSALILAVWVATKTLRFLSLSTQESLWKAALLGGVATASLQMMLGLQSPWGTVELPAALDTAPTAVVQELAEPPAAVDVQRRIVKHRSGDMTITTVRESKPVAAAPVVTTSRKTMPGTVWPWVLLGLVGVGTTFCVGRFVLARRRLRQQLHGRREVVEDPLLENFLTLCDKAGFSVPDKKDKTKKKVSLKLMATEKIRSPLALRREIVVPERAILELGPQQQTAMLAHEMAHVVRRDPLWRMVTAAFEAVFFFQPLNILARKKIHEVAEYQADEWAAEYTGSGAHLAKAIAAVAGWVERGKRDTPLAATMTEGGSIVRRVRRLTRFTRDTRRTSKGWFAARLGTVLSLLGGAMWLVPGISRAEPTIDAAEPAPTHAAALLSLTLDEEEESNEVIFREVRTEDGQERAQVEVDTDEEIVRVEIERDPEPPQPPPVPESRSSVRIIIGGSYDAWGFGEAHGYVDIDIDSEELDREMEELEHELEHMFEPDSWWDERHHEAAERAQARAERARARAERARARALRRAEKARERAEDRAARIHEHARHGRGHSSHRHERAPTRPQPADEPSRGIFEL